jgi:hypothetical protein
MLYAINICYNGMPTVLTLSIYRIRRVKLKTELHSLLRGGSTIFYFVSTDTFDTNVVYTENRNRTLKRREQFETVSPVSILCGYLA